MVPVSYWAVLIAAAASMVLGFLWYGPIFGKQWLRLTGMTEAQVNEAKGKDMTLSYVLMAVGSLLMAYVLSHALVFATSYFLTSGISAGLTVGFWNWLGFIAPVTLGAVLWEGKSWHLWLLNNGYYLLTLLVMGAILAGWVY